MDYIILRLNDRKNDYETKEYIGEDLTLNSVYIFLTMTYLNDIRDLRGWMSGEFKMPDGSLYDKSYFNWEEVGVARLDSGMYVIEEDIGNNEAELTKESFIKLLDGWEKILKEKPEEVKLVWNGESIDFEIIKK